MIRSFFFLFLLAFAYTTKACINEKKALLSGEHVIGYGREDVPTGRSFGDTQYLTAQLYELDKLWKTKKNIDDYSDYGVYLIYLGRYQDAKAVFHEIENMYPSRYATAANIGTIYELLGNNDSALYWIKEAVRIDPSSHMGSEWLHVKILEAKIKGDEAINSHFLLGTDFGNDVKPHANMSQVELEKLKDALYFQLNERVSFIKPEDKIVGLLLFELGNITALTDDVTAALRNYDKAVEYGFVNDVLKKRYEHFLSLQKGLKNEYQDQKIRPWEKKVQSLTLVKSAKTNNGSPYKMIMWVSGSLFVLAAAVLIWRLKRNTY